jgi:threonine synthase
VAQLLVYGAKVILVDGNYDQAFDLSIQAASEFGWYCRNTGYNPFTAEGKKTAALEIWEQVLLNYPEMKKPLCIFTSVGDGNIISGLHKGFKDLVAMGWLENMPRIFGVQAQGSAAVANAYFNNTEDIQSVHAQTIADSISVDLPRDGVRAIRAVRETGGEYFIVKDEDILFAISGLGKSGIFAEPAGAASYAGLVKAMRDKKIHSNDPVLVLVTGSGLKDVKAAMQATGEAPIIEPSLDALKKIL